jgi:CubicO group peptidase (beta-lactamase class C family)
VSGPRVEGWVEPGFERVASAFATNFSKRHELGASFAASVDGRPVVDLWGGSSGYPDRPWAADTICAIFSGTKALIATCILRLVDRGALSLDDPLSRYWPAFKIFGRGDTLVRHVLTHQTGHPGVRTQLSHEDVLAPAHMAEVIGSERPFWTAGSRLCYHPLTFGWLCAELVRRVDGRTLGAFLNDEIARPLNLEIWLGLPVELEHRAARLVRACSISPKVDDEVGRAIEGNPPLFAADFPAWNTRAFRMAEIPGAGVIASARSMARFYSCLAGDGELDGVRLLRRSTLSLARQCHARGPDSRFGWPLAFGLGFALQTPSQEFGQPAAGFGHGGAGGSLHGAWPIERVGFSYVMNHMRMKADRSIALLSALQVAVRALGTRPRERAVTPSGSASPVCRRR